MKNWSGRVYNIFDSIKNVCSYIYNGFANALALLYAAPMQIANFFSFTYNSILTDSQELYDNRYIFVHHLVAIVGTFWAMIQATMYMVITFMSDKALDLFGIKERQGTITFNTGHTEIEISLGQLKPLQVWISIDDCGNIPVCQGSVDKVGVVLKRHSFVLYADVASDSCSVSWEAIVD